ncbi:chaperonin-like RbcX protein 2, chloroplastic isoform X4 [Physcomitrium patens]|uniref:Chaperonin-like RbcX protein n=1 Tax=Physcomitrium patens TaxID=3218 RepID=A0A7I4EGM9_PHYPA|nr:chaperonin-like RbcX protein 2, chloroplastic isoform X2 [Physcomitrium patens]XP_024385593.1 chaperonin-like RbcX protein 2, chloroplastic isoform X2 [Physcomitrium patens]|eukprot:XP_024385592.1 chaperonin-like RbcX protein 2, chloroplastic isoform X2 [Physcomitrella patens]
MVGAALVGASMAAVSLTGPPCRCSSLETAAAGVVVARKQGHSCCKSHKKTIKQAHLYSEMTHAWQDSRLSARVLFHLIPCSASGHHAPVVVDDLGGQYEDTFDDVEKHLLDYFTFKGVKTVLAQLSEMNPTEYAWFYNFVVSNKPQDSKLFLRSLVKERQELGERKYNHVQMHEAISNQNLELLRERLMQTVKLPSDGENIDRPPLRGSD